MNTATKTVVDLGKEIDARQTQAEEIIKAGEEAGSYSVEQMAQLKELNEQIKGMMSSRDDVKEQEALVSTFHERRTQLKQVINPMQFSAPDAPESSGDRIALAAAKGMGELVTENPAFKQWHGTIAPEGHISEKQQINSPAIQIGGSLRGLVGGMKTLVTGASATSGGALFLNYFLGLPDPEGVFHRPLTVLDLIRRIPVTSDIVEYARVGTPTIAAAPVAEATSGSDGAKPESALPLAVVTENIRNIAHWLPITRRALSDAPQVRALIDEFLRYGVLQVLEDQILTGDGTGQNFTGIRSQSGILTQTATGDSIVTIRKAITKVQLQGRTMPSGIALHPNDWETIDLQQDNELRYYLGGPLRMGQPVLWGLPVTINDGVTAAHAIVGNWRWAAIFDREQTAVYVTDSHSDFFIRNIIVILAELRAGFGVIRPKAFCDATVP